ncbi:MAG: hypothetical protein WCE61_14575 [Candidatus Acidiferrum sp.]
MFEPRIVQRWPEADVNGKAPAAPRLYTPRYAADGKYLPMIAFERHANVPHIAADC